MRSYFLVTYSFFLIHSLVGETHSFQPTAHSTSFVNTIFSNAKTIVDNKQSSFSTLKSFTIDQDIQQVTRENEESRVIGKTIFVLPSDAKEKVSKFGSYSPIGNPSILEAIEHIARKIGWFSDSTVATEIIILPSSSLLELKSDIVQDMKQKLLDADALIAMSIVNTEELNFVCNIFDTRRSKGGNNLCQFAIDCDTGDSSVSTLVGPFDKLSPSLSSLFPWTSNATGKRMVDQMLGLFDRWTSDDFVVALLIFFNQYCGTIDWVKYSIDATWEKGPVQNSIEFYKMITKCGDCVSKCVSDEKCKKCLDELTKVDTRDQVASYRTIVSYESELLKDFSFCILQKNNIFGCDAKVPTLPAIEPMKVFRGKKLTKEMAKRILVGHLDDPIALDESAKSEISWKVAAGANVAYDQFPSQNQIFYEASNGRDMWYDPVFRVETIDGRNVWCKRHYRVREAKEAGTFRFSVLDNGVTSNEFWNIVAVADDLSWIVFHYAGAASSVGQRYLGGLICTKDGELPPESARDEIWSKLKTAGIEPWELFVCDNRSDTPGAVAAGPPPLQR